MHETLDKGHGRLEIRWYVLIRSLGCNSNRTGHPSCRTRGHTVNIEKPFRQVVAAADLDPKQVVRHTLRHTAITHLVQAGVDLPTVQRISGHKTMLRISANVTGRFGNGDRLLGVVLRGV